MGGWCGFLSCATFEKCPLPFMKGSCNHYLTSPPVFVSYSVNNTLWFILKISPNKFGYLKKQSIFTLQHAMSVMLHFSFLFCIQHFVFSMEIGNNGYHSERSRGIPNPMMTSIPTYDTMNRFPRASAPPRHIDWWQTASSCSGSWKLVLVLLCSQENHHVPSKTGTKTHHTANFPTPWTRRSSIKAGFFKTQQEHTKSCRCFHLQWSTEPFYSGQSQPLVRLLAAGRQTLLPSASLWARLVVHFSKDCCVCVYICSDTKQSWKKHSVRGHNINCDACSFKCSFLCLRKQWLNGHLKDTARWRRTCFFFLHLKWM